MLTRAEAFPYGGWATVILDDKVYSVSFGYWGAKENPEWYARVSVVYVRGGSGHKSQRELKDGKRKTEVLANALFGGA